MEEANKVLGCLQQANRKLVSFLELIEQESISFEAIKEFKDIVSDTAVEAWRPFCNCLIDICRNRNLHGRAHELLYLGTMFGLSPDLHNKTVDEWRSDVCALSVGAAHTALEEWMETLARFVQRNESLPEIFLAHTGAGTLKFSHGLSSTFASHVKKLASPFTLSKERAGCFAATREGVVTWVQSRTLSNVAA